MKFTPYFHDNFAKHGVSEAEVATAMDSEVERRVQGNGRIQVWGRVPERKPYLLVILLSDGETVLNAFYDSNYTRKRGRK